MSKIINFTGHNLTEGVEKYLYKKLGEMGIEVTGIETIKFGIRRRQDSWEQVKRLMQNIKADLNDGTQPIVILPGLPIAGALILLYIHGVSGCFPKVVEMIRDNRKGIWKISEIHDLEWLRQNSRKFR